MPFPTAPKRVKRLGVNLPKEACAPKTVKTLTEETGVYTSKREDTPCSWVGSVNIVEMTTQQAIKTPVSAVDSAADLIQVLSIFLSA